jgi:probable phosphoglycerate mutase
MTKEGDTVLLVRHGETEWNRTERIQGWAPVGLNDRGREQAVAAGDHLDAAYDPDRIVASDLRRTRETARAIRQATGLDHDRLEFESAWRERSFGVFQGLSYEAVYGNHPEFAVGEVGVAALEHTPEGGESVVDARKRVLAGWDGLLAGLDGGTVAVVTHGGPIHVLAAHVANRDLVTELDGNQTQNGAIYEFHVDGDRATADREGVVPPGAPAPGETGGIR